MSVGLYYPHSAIESDEVLATALLMWDHVEFIVPNVDFVRTPADPFTC